MIPIQRLFRFLVMTVTVALIATLASCGGDSGGGSSSGSVGQTGSVAVLFTDNPTTEFDEINVTVTRIELIGEDEGHVEVFSGERIVNLLDLKNNSDVFSLVEVNAGIFDKVRLTVTGLELVKKDDQGNVEVVQPRIPANGKIDLNPRADIIVAAGETLVLELDMDAEKSIHLVETGSGKYNFRPVVFVNIVGGPDTGKFVKLSGTMELEGTDPETYRLCDTEVVFDSDDDGDGDLDDGENDTDDSDDASDDDVFNGDDDPQCLMLQLTDNTSVFNADGAAGVADILDGDLATVVGRLQVMGDGAVLNVLAIELGLSGTFADVEGTVATGYDDATGQFELDVSEGGGFAEGTRISVELLDGAKVLSRLGQVLAPEDIEFGRELRIEGLLTGEAPELQASVVFVDAESVSDDQKLSGTVSTGAGDGWDFMLLGTAAAGDVCVRLEEDGEIFQVTTEGGSLVSEMIGLDGLSDGQAADVYGRFEPFGGGCFDAEAVVAATPDPAAP